MTTKIAVQYLENDEENLRAAQEELDLNTPEKTEAELVEERKTLARLKIESRDGLPSIWAIPKWKKEMAADELAERAEAQKLEGKSGGIWAGGQTSVKPSAN